MGPMRRKLLTAAVLVGLMLAWIGTALWRSGAAASYSQSVSITPPNAGAAPGPPVELEFTILKVPAGARSQKAVQKMLEGIGSQASALTPERTAALSDQMLLAIAPAYVGVVSRPRLRVLSGTEAELKIAENVPIGSATTPVGGDLMLRVSPQLAPDGAATLGVALSLSRAEGTLGVVLDSAGLPAAKHASGSGIVSTAPGGCVAFTLTLGRDELLVVALPRPVPVPADPAKGTGTDPGAAPK
jgi:hypothetical protein